MSLIHRLAELRESEERAILFTAVEGDAAGTKVLVFESGERIGDGLEEAVAQFDELFRAHLSALYRAIDLTPPKALSMPFASGVAHDVAAGGTMQRGS